MNLLKGRPVLKLQRLVGENISVRSFLFFLNTEERLNQLV